jgi:hypothetical protein
MFSSLSFELEIASEVRALRSGILDGYPLLQYRSFPFVSLESTVFEFTPQLMQLPLQEVRFMGRFVERSGS